MRKFFRYIIQYAILVALGFGVYQTTFKRDTPPVHDRAAWSQRDGFVALSYGGILPEDGNPELISKTRLAKHLEALAKAGYQTITTEDIYNFYNKNKPLPDKALYLMFEGGRKDSVIFSQPILSRIGYNATLFAFGERLNSWERFFIREPELQTLAHSPFWGVGSMGYQARILGLSPDGKPRHYLTDYLRAPDGSPAEDQAAFDARVTKDFAQVVQTLRRANVPEPWVYVMVPANTLGNSLPEALAKPITAAIETNFPVAFTHFGDSYNSRETDPRTLNRLGVDSTWTAEQLLWEIESQLPRTRFTDFAGSVEQGLWRIKLGTLHDKDTQLLLTTEPNVEGLAELRGTKGFEDFLCQVTITPPSQGAGLLYLRYRSPESYLRLQVTTSRLLVQEKTGADLNTLFQYPFPPGHPATVALELCLKGNRLLLTVNGAQPSTYPIPLSDKTRQGSFEIGALPMPESTTTVFSGLDLTRFSHRWVQVEHMSAVPWNEAQTVTTVLIPVPPADAPRADVAASMIQAMSNGLGVYWDMTRGNAPAALATLDALESAPNAAVIRTLLQGVVVSLGQFPDNAAFCQEMARLHDKGLRVGLLLGPDAVKRLLESSLTSDPDWLLFTATPEDLGAAMTALKNRFDRKHMLFRQTPSSGAQITYYNAIW